MYLGKAKKQDNKEGKETLEDSPGWTLYASVMRMLFRTWKLSGSSLRGVSKMA